MKTKVILLLFTFLAFFANAQKYDTLYNKTIISLTKMGLTPKTIISKIQTSYTSFDVGIKALSELSENGVNGDVIEEMIKTNDKANTQIINEINSNDPAAMHKSGIYIYDPGDQENLLKKIHVVRVSSYASGGGGYGGYGGSSTSAVLTGGKSKQQLDDQSPVFYFYFNPQNSTKDDWYEGAESPNEFALIKVIEKKDQRLFKVGGSSSFSYGSSSSRGIPEKTKLPFEFDQISEGIYKVTLSKPLEPGEYCFVFALETDKVYDFGIHPDKKKK